MKVCTRCKAEKDTSHFGKDRNRPDGHFPQCRECVNAARRVANAPASWISANRERAKRYSSENRAAENARLRLQGYRRRAQMRDVATETISSADIASLVALFGGVCAYCPAPWEHLDHYIPLARGGSHTIANLVPACAACNLSKGAKLPITEWTGRPSCASASARPVTRGSVDLAA